MTELHDAIERCRAALHSEIPGVTSLPFTVARLIAWTRGAAGKEMAGAAAFVRYFETITEGERDADVDRLLGGCATTLDAWLTARAARAPASAA